MKAASTAFATLAVMTVLSGCLSKAPSHGNIVGQSLPKGTAIPPAWTADPGANGPVNDNWLASFHDPQLDALVAEAIAKNLDLAQAAQQVEIARQNVVVISSQLKPQVSLDFGAATLRDASQSSNHNSSRGTFGIGWEPDVWGMLRAERAAAKQGYAATALDYAWARQSLAATTAQSWYQAVALRQILAIEDETVSAYTELLRLAKVKQVAGQVADLDVAEATANLNEAQDQVRKTQGLLSAAERNLEVLLGRYPAADLVVKREFDTLPPLVQAGLPSTLLERRPDIAAAEHLVLEAFRIHEAAKLALLPSFSLNLDGGKINDTLLDIVHQNPVFYRAAVGMTVPIYTGGRLTAQVKIASALERQSIEYYGSVTLNAFREVEDALTNERVLAERFFYLDSALTARIESVRLATIKYKAGASDMLPVLQLQTSQYETQVELTMVRAGRLTNCIDLHLALGGGFNAAPARSTP